MTAITNSLPTFTLQAVPAKNITVAEAKPSAQYAEVATPKATAVSKEYPKERMDSKRFGLGSQSIVLTQVHSLFATFSLTPSYPDGAYATIARFGVYRSRFGTTVGRMVWVLHIEIIEHTTGTAT